MLKTNCKFTCELKCGKQVYLFHSNFGELLVPKMKIEHQTVSETELRINVVETAVPEPANRVWKEVLSASYSSSTSGNWSWDASDQSVPSTPSPPLSNDANKNFLLSSQGDDVSEDVTESTHFMFEDPIPRKRKVNVLKQHNTGADADI